MICNDLQIATSPFRLLAMTFSTSSDGWAGVGLKSTNIVGDTSLPQTRPVMCFYTVFSPESLEQTQCRFGACPPNYLFFMISASVGSKLPTYNLTPLKLPTYNLTPASYRPTIFYYATGCPPRADALGGRHPDAGAYMYNPLRMSLYSILRDNQNVHISQLMDACQPHCFKLNFY